jgi:hypothetical protein
MANEAHLEALHAGTVELEVTFDHTATTNDLRILIEGIQDFADLVAEAHGEVPPTVWVTRVSHPNSLIAIASALFVAHKAAIMAAVPVVLTTLVGLVNLRTAHVNRAIARRNEATADKSVAIADINRETAELNRKTAELNAQLAAERAVRERGAAVAPAAAPAAAPAVAPAAAAPSPGENPMLNAPKASEQRWTNELVASEHDVRAELASALKHALQEWKPVRGELSEPQQQELLKALITARLSPTTRLVGEQMTMSLGMSLGVRAQPAATPDPENSPAKAPAKSVR